MWGKDGGLAGPEAASYSILVLLSLPHFLPRIEVNNLGLINSHLELQEIFVYMYIFLRRQLIPFIKFSKTGTSLVAKWLRIRLPMQGTQVRALVREEATCRGATKPVRHNY